MSNETYYELWLYDFGNLQSKMILKDDSRVKLDEACESINYLFAQAGQSRNFQAEVFTISMLECDQ